MSNIYLAMIPIMLRDAFEHLEYDEETGEILNAEAITDVQCAAEEKIAGCAMYVKDMTADVEALSAAIREMSDRKAALVKRIEKVKALMLPAVQATGKVKTPFVTVSTRRSVGVVIDDVSAIPENFIKVEKTPRKTDLMAALKTGAEIAGAHLEERESVSISTARKAASHDA